MTLWSVWLSAPGDPPNSGNAVPRRAWADWVATARGEAETFACREEAEQRAIEIAASCYRDRYDAIRVRPYSPRARGELARCVPDLSALTGFFHGGMKVRA